MPPTQTDSRAASLPILSVGDLTALVKNTLRSQPRLREVWVEGEVGQVSISAAGHCYFTLKDERAQLKCVIFRDDRMVMPFEARTGLRLIAQGSIDVFDAQGVYQLYVRSIQPSGFGDLAIQFEALKAKLAAEGLFEQSRKRKLPQMPQNIGVVTSLSGAVLHDIRRVLARRWPLARVVVSACQVQGQGAAATIVAALRRVARWTDDETGRATDVVILARGGGSLEDLWPFNDESVVRAVAAHPCPIVVGVGHETDVTLAELLEFLRADATDESPYVQDLRMCGTFAEQLHNSAEAEGIRAAWVSLDLQGQEIGHALNAFVTTDRGLVFVDSTGDNPLAIVSPDGGRGECECDRIAYVRVGSEYGLISIDRAVDPAYDFYVTYSAAWESYLGDVSAFNALATEYNATVQGRTLVAGSDEARAALRMRAELDAMRTDMEMQREVLGPCRWTTLGVVEWARLYW